MSSNWPDTVLTLENADDVLINLRGDRWFCRGQPKCYPRLLPLIDRYEIESLSRSGKLALERRSINLYRSTARYFADAGEEQALFHDEIALMVLRHYGVPTRLLDWTMSPYVAAYFAASDHGEEDGEIWTFDQRRYDEKAPAQWIRWRETTTDGSGDGRMFSVALTAFTVAEPNPWLICHFYKPGFHRQNAQQGLYTMTPDFGRDHRDAIASLLDGDTHYHRYVVPAALKPMLLSLCDSHGIRRGSLFPDSAGAAETAASVFKEYKPRRAKESCAIRVDTP